MLTPQELRIGNWVIINDGPGAVRSPYEYQIEGSHDLMKMESHDDPKENGVQGVPITPKVLEKCGIRETGEKGTYSVMDEDFYMRRIADPVYTWMIGVCTSSNRGEFAYIIDVEYLHQAQNAFYVLTGKELQYTP